jgi:amino acid permease
LTANRENIEVITEKRCLNTDKRAWMFSLVGAGIGAGILFLPIETGQAGFIISIIALVISYPIVYFAQKYLMILVLKANNAESINDAIEDYIGKYFAILFSLIYGIMTFVMVSAYAIGINTTIVSLFNSLGVINTKLTSIQFSLLAFIILGILTILALFGERLLIKLLGYITIILIFLLILTSILFIPEWHLARLIDIDLSARGIISNLFILVPIFVFAITVIQPLSPLISFFRFNHKNLTKEELNKAAFTTYKKGFMLFVGLVAVFTFSAILVIEPATLAYAKANNLSALVVIEHSKDSASIMLSILKYLGMGITFFALLTSYYGIGFGFTETLAGNLKFLNISFKKKKVISTIVFNILLWLFVTFNLNIVNTIGIFIVPCMGILVFILPAAIIILNKKFESKRNLMTYLVMACGVFLVVSFFIGLSMK